MRTAMILLAAAVSFSAVQAQSPAQHSTDWAVPLLEKCRQHLDNNEEGKAVKCAEQILEHDEKNVEALYLMGMAYVNKAQNASMFKKLSFAKKGKKSWLACMDIDSAYVPAIIALINYNVQAPSIAGGSKEDAAALAKRLIKIDALKGHTFLGFVYAQDGSTEEAETEYKKAVSLSREETWPRFNLAVFYQNQARYSESNAEFDNILEQEPENAQALYQKGKNAALSGKNLEAGKLSLQRYLSADYGEDSPQEAAAFWRIGMIYEHEGKTDSARISYQSALAADRDFTEAREALKKLQ